MRYAKWMFITSLLVLAASSVWAQCYVPTDTTPACPQPVQVQCPQACPQPCPTVEPCPAACCPCPASVPAAMGAGPAANLQGLTCPDFDPNYARSMYQQNATIISVAQYGQKRASDKNLRNISGEIAGYLTSANSKMQGWYGTATCGVLGVDCGTAQAIINQLAAVPDNCFDAVYAKTLSQLISQSNSAETIAATDATSKQMRDQARFLADKESDWVFRLDRWVGDHS